MTGFTQFGTGTTLQQIIDARRSDAAVIDNILEYKVQGRDRTGLRVIPSDETDTINGDKKGDYLYDLTDGYRYEIVNNSGTLQWVRWAIEATFTYP